VQAPVALGMVEQLAEQVVDPLARRRGQRTVEVAVRHRPAPASAP
jgi:hypothetical protein